MWGVRDWGGGRGGKEMGSPACQAEGGGLCLLTLFLASFIMDSKASKLLSVWTQHPHATPGRAGGLGETGSLQF